MKILQTPAMEALASGFAARNAPLPSLPSGKAPQERRALVLGGGSQKGSFELGATQYLYRRKLTPGLVIGTSVGTINGVKLAEGERAGPTGYRSGLAGLERIWGEIDETADFLDTIVDVDALAAEVKQIAAKAGGITLGWLLAGGPLGLVVSGVVTGTAAKAKLEKLADDVLHAGGQYSLAPIMKRLKDAENLKMELVQASSIDAYFVWVGQFSGLTFLTGKDRSLRLMQDPATSVGTVDDIYAAIEASAAQPAFMQLPVVKGALNGRRFAERGMDGGITDIGAVQAAFQLGAEEVYAIFTSPSTPPFIDPITGEISAENPIFQKQSVPTGIGTSTQSVHLAELRSAKNILNTGMRAMELLLYEVQRGDIPAGVPGLHVIRPSVRVFEDFEVTSALVDINRKHGWMSAFDSFLTGADRALASLHTTVITRYQLEANRLELSAANMATNPALSSLAARQRAEAAELNEAVETFLTFRKTRWGNDANAPALQKDRPRG